MNEKPTIVQVINDLSRGGAETLLVGLLKDLDRHYNVILVTLNGACEFDDREIICSARYTLNYTSMYKLPQAVTSLRRIIKKHRPVLVGSHLFWSTIILRLATPRQIPLVFTVHQMLSEGAFNFNRRGKLLRWLDKMTYHRRQTMIGVSEEVVRDYDREIGITGERYVLNNYVEDVFFESNPLREFRSGGKVKMVVVGNPKWEKNYEVLVRAFKLLDKGSVSCDIYGMSEYSSFIQKMIDEYEVPIIQKGKVSDIHERLMHYDLFIMPSRSEGFGIAAAEAMAAGLPLLLSNLDVLREVSHNNAVFFDTEDEKDLAQKINDIIKGKYDLKRMSEEGRVISRECYSKGVYLKNLLRIYGRMIQAGKDLRKDTRLQLG